MQVHMYIHGDFGVRELLGTASSVLQAMHIASFPLGSINFGTINWGGGSPGGGSGGLYVPAHTIRGIARPLPGNSPDLTGLLHGLLPYLRAAGGLVIPQASGNASGGGIFTGGGGPSGNVLGGGILIGGGGLSGNVLGGGIITGGGGLSGNASGGGIITGGGGLSGNASGGGIITGGGGTSGNVLGGGILIGGGGTPGSVLGGGSIGSLGPLVVNLGNGKVQIRHGLFTRIIPILP